MIELRQTQIFQRWLNGLKNRKDAARIVDRLLRLERGNFGNHKGPGSSLEELRFSFGPGYRVYFTRKGDVVIILLAGGTKRRQESDFERARVLMENVE
ncbi:MAG: type II toxin-antitoxin system RelE/ParE family toxin [Pseudomonadota bacterium]